MLNVSLPLVAVNQNGALPPLQNNNLRNRLRNKRMCVRAPTRLLSVIRFTAATGTR